MHYKNINIVLFVILCWRVEQIVCVGNCPDEAAILPCYCQDLADDDVRIYCNDAETETEIEEAFLADFPILNLTSFHIENNQKLTTLSKNLFVFKTFNSIDIFNTNISSIESSFFDNCYETLKNLDITFSAVSEFPFDSLSRFSQLTSVTVSYNALTSLPKLSSSTIINLFLSNNYIETLDDFVFRDCPELEYISLGSNLISEIPISSFIGANSLQFISLDQNQIEVLRTGSFAAITDLTVLWMPLNPITTIEDGAFVDLQNLTSLSLAFTSITSLRRNIFFDVFNLENFEMNSCNIETIEPYTFVDFQSDSIIISLSSNKISTIVADAFSGVSGYHINLNYNTVSMIEEGAFRDLKNSTILLANNSIQTLDENWLGPILAANNTINMQDNPLECGCDLAWILTSGDFFNLLSGSPTCANGTYLSDLNFFYYLSNCEQEQKKFPLVIDNFE